MITLVVCGLSVLIFIYHVKVKDSDPIFGVYAVPGKWYYLKYVLFSGIYYFRKFVGQYMPAGNDGSAGQGMKAVANLNDIDKALPLGKDPLAFDAVFFTASKSEGDKGVHVIAGCERRPKGICYGVFYIALPGKGLLCGNKLPDTVLFGGEDGYFGAEGYRYTPEVPMTKWSLSYKGKMRYQNNPEKLVHVDFTGEWTATSPVFDYDSDLHPPSVIRSIALEKWSRAYFQQLKTAHQSHYEQFGDLKCKIKIEDETFEYTLQSCRDHSFGPKRDWTLLHRYAFQHMFLENGVNISLGVISQPSTASVFEVGEVAFPNGRIIPIKWTDLKLYQHGEDGVPPQDFAFRFQAGDEIYNVKVIVEHEAIHYVSADWEARMVERMCKFVINGVPGRGISEFQYRHKGGRPESVSKNDPEWFRKMRQV